MEANTLDPPDVLSCATVCSPSTFELTHCRAAAILPAKAVACAACFGLTPTFVQAISSPTPNKWVKVEQLSRANTPAHGINAPVSVVTSVVAGRRVTLVRVLYSFNTSPKRTADTKRQDHGGFLLVLRGFRPEEAMRLCVPSNNHATYGILMPFEDGCLLSDACMFVQNMPSAGAWARCQHLDLLADVVNKSTAPVPIASAFDYKPTPSDSGYIPTGLTVDAVIEWACTQPLQVHYELAHRVNASYHRRYDELNAKKEAPL